MASPTSQGRGDVLGSDLRLDSLAKTYIGTASAAVNDVSFVVPAGSFATLLGPSGSGKTTTLMMIAGFVRPDRGDVYIGGRRITALPPHKRELSMVFQNYALFPHMTVRQNVAFPLVIRRAPQETVQAQVMTALDMVQLLDYGDRYPRQLSGGQQQRVALARAIVFAPTVLLMDEPLGALDKQLREQMQLEIKSIQQRLGVTVVYVTHDQGEALSMSDLVVLMRDGVIEQIGTPAALYETPANSFVGSFIGESNLLPGSFRSGNDGFASVVDSQGHAIDGVPRDRLREGDAVVALIRPEHIELTDSPRGAERGRIVAAIYGGDAIKYRIALSNAEITARRPNHPDEIRLAAGEEVFVRWDVSHVQILSS